MLIKQGDVLLNGEKVLKAGKLVSDTDQIEIKSRNIYVGRGAFKLLHALKEFEIDFSDKVIADCGASTGGFTQVALEKGAKKVYAIDVGHDQLDDILKAHPRVENIEGINLKNDFTLPEKVDFCVVDLSFISLKMTYPTISTLLKPDGQSIVLIKPQFEAGRERLGKNGIVREEDLDEIISEVKEWFEVSGHTISKFIESPVLGKEGNKEFLALIN